MVKEINTLADKKAIKQIESKGKCPIKITTEGKEIKEVSYNEPYNSFKDPFIQVIKSLTGTNDTNIAMEIFERSALAMPKDNSIGTTVNILLESLADSAPKGSTEAKLILQSTVLYAQSMLFIFKAGNSDCLEYSEFYMKNAIKLLRLQNETIEVLSKYRRGGEQKVIVQHVQVNEGGKAIVGNMLNGGV